MAEVQELPASVTRVKKELTTPRDISKKHDPEGRSALASTILGARNEGRLTRDSLTAKEQERGGILEQFSGLQAQIEQTTTGLTERSNAKLVKLKVKLGIGDKKVSELEAQLANTGTEREVVNDQAIQAAHEIAELKQKQGEIPDPKELLKAYYEKQETQPLTNQEKRELLTPEVLESLTTEEYIVLWRRLNPYFLSHVTRQGFRDHNAMIYHSAGLAEFHNGFVKVLEDGKQNRPPLAINGLRTRDEESVRRYLSNWILEAPNQEEALDRFDKRLRSGLASAPSYPDKTAVHFAAQEVANDFYGGEINNDAFFVFPSDVIASQHNFAFSVFGKGISFTKPHYETKWNDVFVWPKTLDNPGISVDAGFVFLPENTRVDPITGSKYASEVQVIDGKEQRVMVEDTNLVNSFVSWIKGLSEDSALSQAYKKYSYRDADEERREFLTVAYEEVQKLGIDPEAAAAIANDNSLRNRLAQAKHGNEVPDEAWKDILGSSNANWKRPEQTIPAKQYWENYFVQNPHLKPKHIVYYDGDPTTAVYEFQQKNNIGRADTSGIEGELLGFDDHLVELKGSGGLSMIEDQDPRSMAGYNELKEMGNKIITEHYKGPTGIAA